MGKDKVQKMSIFGQSKAKQGVIVNAANWSEIDQSLILKLIDVATSRGGAVRFGYTRDGGAYALGLYYGGDHTTEYIRPGEDIGARLVDLIGTYEALPYSGGKSPDQG